MSKRGYHHGNLRQALVEATLALIEEKGPQGFTLSEAAKAVDVTPAAVYRHFSGREELIAEVARQGYEIFTALMDFAYDNGKPTALAAFEATGRAYLAFARKYPGYYQAMFESGIPITSNPDLALVAARATAVLENSAKALSANIPPEKRPPPGHVRRPYLGHEPRGSGAFHPRHPRRPQPLRGGRSAGGGHRHLSARSGAAASGPLTR